MKIADSSGKVSIKDYGTYDYEVEVDDTVKYFTKPIHLSGYGRDCNKEVKKDLFTLWAKKNGVYSDVWTVKEIDDYEYSSSIGIYLENDKVDISLKFVLSSDDWHEKQSVQELVESHQGDDITQSLEGEDMFVSMVDYTNCEYLSRVNRHWYVYRTEDAPNFLVQLWNKYL